MDRFRLPAALTLAGLAALAAAAPGSPAAPRPRPASPTTWLWAWESPQDLRFLEGRNAGVAYLATTLVLDGGLVLERARMQPLRLPPRAPRMPVVRIELARPGAGGEGAAGITPPALSVAQRAELVARIARLARRPATHAVQIDFDAPRSARPFYRDLLAGVRAAIPDTVALSMTALASWCWGDRWLEGLPVDEIVPMYFRMGADGPEVRRRLALAAFPWAAPDERPCRACEASVGLATDEPTPAPHARARRVYWFHAGPWTREAFEGAAGRSEGRVADGS